MCKIVNLLQLGIKLQSMAEFLLVSIQRMAIRVRTSQLLLPMGMNLYKRPTTAKPLGKLRK